MIKFNKFRQPNFNTDKLKNAPNAKFEEVKIEGVAPENYHAMSIYPEFFKVDGKWLGVSESRMDTVPVIKEDKIEVIAFTNLKVGD